MSEDLASLRRAPKKALGRGLGSLLGEMSTQATVEKSGDISSKDMTTKETLSKSALSLEVAKKTESTATLQTPAANDQKVWSLPIEKLIPNKEQPRKTFRPEMLTELSNSIKEKGIILPIIVKQNSVNQYEIIAGERRWRAAQMAGKKEVPVVIRDAPNSESLELALIENIQRHNLNPMEEAEAYNLLVVKYHLTQNDVAQKVGKERSTVANLMRLVALPQEVKELIKEGSLQLGQAKVLLSLDSAADQIKVAKKIVQLRLSVRATEKLINQIKSSETKAASLIANTDVLREMRQVTSELQKITGTKVSVESFGEGAKVAFRFYSREELNQFIDLIRGNRR